MSDATLDSGAASLAANAPPDAVLSQRMDNLSDWFNPILIKEIRQALKSRQFLATFLLMLLASWLIACFGILLTTGLEYGRTGGGFFYAFFVVLCVASIIIVPFGAFRSLLGERDQFTFEVLSISTLKPRQVVLGKLMCSVTQLFIYFSAITPFIAFTYLLRGVDVLSLMLALVATMLYAIGLSMIGLTLSTLSQQRHWQTLSTLAILFGLLSAFFPWAFGFGATAALYSGIPFNEPEFWISLTFILLLYAAYFWLLLQISVAQLTFEADNRSTGIRLGMTIVFLIGSATLYVCFLAAAYGWSWAPAPSSLDEMAFAYAVLGLIHFAGLGLFIVTEPEHLSRRVKKRLPRLIPLRLVELIFLPGGGRGLLYVYMHLVALLAISLIIMGTASSSSTDSMPSLIAAAMYLVTYLNLGAWLGRWGRQASSEFRAPHARVLLLILIAAFAIMPFLVDLLLQRNEVNVFLYLTNPIIVLNHIYDQGVHTSELMFLLGVGAAVSLLLNLRAMLGGVWEVLAAPVVPREAPVIKAVLEPEQPLPETTSAPEPA